DCNEIACGLLGIVARRRILGLGADGTAIALGCEGNAPDSSARVRVCLATSTANRAMKAAEDRLHVPLMTLLGMNQRASISLTSRVVQLQGATSLPISRTARTSGESGRDRLGSGDDVEHRVGNLGSIGSILRISSSCMRYPSRCNPTTHERNIDTHDAS